MRLLGGSRPGYRALLESVACGDVDVVLVWHADRLYRRMHDLEEYISICQPRAIPTLTVQAGPLDLATPSGRMVARTLGSVAQYESEQKAERQKRANFQRALHCRGDTRARSEYSLRAGGHRRTSICSNVVGRRTSELGRGAITIEVCLALTPNPLGLASAVR